jgi:hypothetical protein
MLLLFAVDAHIQGFNSVERNVTALQKLWCEDRLNWLDALGENITDSSHQCTEMSLQVSVWGIYRPW